MGLKHAPVWVLFFINFFMSLAMAYFTNHAEIYLGGLGMADATIGFYFSVAGIGNIIAPYAMAGLNHNFRIHTILAGASTLCAGVLLCMNLTLSNQFAMYNMLAFLLMNGIIVGSASLFLSAHVEEENRGFIISLYTAFNFAAWAIAPYIAPWAEYTLPGINIFGCLMAVLGALLFITKFGLKLEQEAEQIEVVEDKTDAKGKGFLLLPFYLFVALPIIALSNLFYGFAAEGAADTLMLFGQSNHASANERDIWVSACSWGVFLIPFLGKLTDKIGPITSYLLQNFVFFLVGLYIYFIPLTALTGTVFFATYSTYLAWSSLLYLTYLSQMYKRKKLINSIAGAQVLISVGAVFGPTVFGKMLACFGDSGYLGLMVFPPAAIFFVALFTLIRAKMRLNPAT